MGQEKLLDISWSTIFKIGAGGLALYALFLTKDILVWVLFGVIVSVMLDPIVDALTRFRIPRAVAVATVYIAIFGCIAFLIWGTTPFFIGEVERFSQLLPQYFETLSPALRGLGITAFSSTQAFFDSVSGSAEKIAGNALNALFLVFGGIFSSIFVLSIAIFLSLDEKAVEKGIVSLFSKKYEAFALSVWEKSKNKVAAWFASRIIASLFVGLATCVSLILFHVEYPFSLGVLSFILNFIPVVGPLISALLIGVVVGLDSLLKAVFVISTFMLVQQIEGSILTPIITKKFLGIPPALVLIALAAGGELWGIMGAIMAVPLAGIVYEFLKDFLKKRKEEEIR